MKVLSKIVSAVAVIAFAAGSACADTFLIGPQNVQPTGLGTVHTVLVLSEPAAMLLLGSGLVGIASALRKRRRKSVKN